MSSLISTLEHEPGLPDFVRDIDAKTLYFFVRLCRTESLPRTAEEMGVSPSSANRMLAKLRRYWGGDLFERSGAFMQPTNEAKDRLEQAVRVLHLLEDMRRPGTIEPAHITRTLRVACYDNAFACCVASVYAAFQAVFPRVTFQITQADEHMFDSLCDDKLDLLFFARQGLHPDVRATEAVTTPYACIVRRHHPLVRTAERHGYVDRLDLARFSQVLVNAQPDRYRRPNSPGNGYFNPDDPGGIALVTPFFLSVPLCIRGTDRYAIVPMLTAREAFDASEVAILPVSPKAPSLTIRLGWHKRRQTDPAATQIRSTLLDLIARRAADVLARPTPSAKDAAP